MPSKRVTIYGMGRLQARLRGYTGGVKEAVAAAVNETAKEVYGESQRRVPVDTGNLRGTGRIDGAKPETLTATLSYGGTAADYALVVHETHATKSKYLEAPAREAAKDLKEGVAKAIRGAAP